MAPFDYPTVPPLPQRRAAQSPIDDIGADSDITQLWLKYREQVTFNEQLVIYINSMAEVIEDLQNRVVDLETP